MKRLRPVAPLGAQVALHRPGRLPAKTFALGGKTVNIMTEREAAHAGLTTYKHGVEVAQHAITGLWSAIRWRHGRLARQVAFEERETAIAFALMNWPNEEAVDPNELRIGA